MSTGKTYSTKYLLDSNNNRGAAGQVLSTTSTGIDWVDANTIPGIIGGPFLPLTAGSSYPLTGDLTIAKTAPTLILYKTGGSNIDPSGTIIFKENLAAEHFQISYNGLNDRLEFKGLISTTMTNLVYIKRDTTTPLNVLGGAYFAGNVGINVTGPGEKLEVNGNIRIYNSSNAPYIDFTENGAVTDSKARITMDQIDTNNGTLIFSTETGGTLSEKMRIDSNGVIQLTSGINGYLNTNSIGMEMDINRNPETGAFKDAGLSHARIIMRGDTTANGGSNIKFVTSPTVNTVGITKMTITGAGDVGIGTDEPSEKLHVVGNVFLNANSAYKASYNNTDNYHGSMRWAGLQLGNNGVNKIVAGRTNTGGRFQFYTNNTNDAADYTVTPDGIMTMTMTETGRVGIGVTGPTAKLDVVDPDSTTASAIKTLVLGGGTSTTGNGQYIQFRSSSNDTLGSEIAGTRTGSGARSSLTFSTTDSTSVVRQRMVIDSAGAIQLKAYGAGTLVSDASGNITVSSGGGAGGPFLPLSAGVSNELTGILKLASSTTTGANHIVMGEGSSRYINYRLIDTPDNTGIIYIILCAYAGGNDVNGTIKMDRTSGLRFATSIDVLVSAGSSATPVGGLRAVSTAGNGEPNCELVKVTYDPGTGTASEHIAVKVTNPDNYYESTGVYFTGRSSVIGVMKPVVPSEVSSETSFEANTRFNAQGASYFDGLLDVKNTGNYETIRIGNSRAANTNKQGGITALNYVGNSTSIFQYATNVGGNTVYYGSADGSFRGLTQHSFMVSSGPDTVSHAQPLKLTAALVTMAADVTMTGSVGIGETTLQRKFNLYDGTDTWTRVRCGASTADWLHGIAGSDHTYKWYNQSSNGGTGYKMELATSGALTLSGPIKGTQYNLSGNVSNPTTTAVAIYDQAAVGLTLSAHNIELRNYNGSAMVRSVFFTHNTATFTGTCTATNFILSSDETLKENVKDIDNKHIDVSWKSFELKSEPGVKRSGVIAQELETKHPEFVRTNEDGLKSVAYIDLLIAKIAELEARLEKAGI